MGRFGFIEFHLHPAYLASFVCEKLHKLNFIGWFLDPSRATRSHERAQLQCGTAFACFTNTFLLLTNSHPPSHLKLTPPPVLTLIWTAVTQGGCVCVCVFSC